ncbi:hypothetical protein AK88_04816 [Plasmodium fragile]|uniref:Uncharacterized protein n=1 Tax=Plasmodium fragile TaxID=5857 RepID=A0A0D9QES0_PLAFR|nr:uncharacterized protein AK88_04816 [Plasmodium fragile]KJP85550.1 hypothetical protein AK88_04816 [Plasmodium fragile]
MVFKRITHKASQMLTGSDVVKQTDVKVKASLGNETKALIPDHCKGGHTDGESTHVNTQPDQHPTTTNDKQKILHLRAKKKVNLFLKRYKLEEFEDKYEEEKSFRETIKSYHSNELGKDCSYAVFFFRLFMKGEYLNGEALTEALAKDNRKDAQVPDHLPLPHLSQSNPDQTSNIRSKNLKKFLAFLNGRNTRLLMCDYLKILMNNIQNENEISTNFLILEYVASHETNQQNDYTPICNTYKLKGHVKEEHSTLSYSLNSVKEADGSSLPSAGPLMENSQNQHVDNNADGSNTQKKNNKNVTNSAEVTTHGGDRSEEAIASSEEATPKGSEHREGDNVTQKKANTDVVQMNEPLFNKILTNFVTELRSFFVSLLAKIQTSQIVSQLIIAFAEICLTLTPYYVHIINCIEVLSDFANIIPIRHMDQFISFFKTNKNIFIEKYKVFQNCVIFNDPIKTQSSSILLHSQKKKNNTIKKCKKINKLKKIKEDYLTILNLQKEFEDKYEEEKSFRETIKSYHSNELGKDCSYAVFFFRLFMKGEYLNGEALTEALAKDNRKDAQVPDHLPLPHLSQSNPDQTSNIRSKNLKKFLAFLNGRNTRLLMCDYLKILMNNIQNENEISTNFLILEYVASHETNQQNDYTPICNTYKLKGHVKEEHSTLSYSLNSVKEADGSSLPSAGPLMENSQNQHVDNNADGSNTQKKNNKNVTNSAEVTTHGGDRSEEAIASSEEATPKGSEHREGDNVTQKKANTDVVQMNEPLFNKILTNFVTELRSFFVSLLAKIQTSQIVSQLIIAFAEICLTLTPYYVHIINCIEVLSDFANIIPIRHMDQFISFFKTNKNIFIEKYKVFQNCVIFNDPIKTQSVGARLIGFIKNLQKKNYLNKKQKSSNVFFLHMLLSECLPINHLGFCNRQSAKNNFHLFFYDSMTRCKNASTNESLIFNDFELGIQENAKNHNKIRELILAEMDSLCRQAPPDGAMSCTATEAKTDGDEVDHHHDDDEGDKGKKAPTHGGDSSGKRKRDEEDNPDQVTHSDKKDNKRQKRNKVTENTNEENKNYKAYLAYLYLISFVRYPEMCTAQNCAPLEDAYHSFNLFMAHVKNLKKKNLTSSKMVKEYLYNADIDFLGNVHIYNLLIRDKNFLCVFFFNILLVLNYLNIELNILTPTANEASSNEHKTNDSKMKETNRSNTSTHNVEPANQSASAHSLDATKSNEDKTATSPFSRNSARAYAKNSKEETSHMSSNTSSLNTKGRDNDSAQPGMANTSRGNHNGPRESKDVRDNNASDTKGNDHQSVSERTKHIFHSFVKDLLRYLGNSKSLHFFMSLLASEYCWYTWKKQLTGKPTKENLQPCFEFIRMEDQSNSFIKNKKEKTNIRDSGMVDEKSSPLHSLIQLVHNFEVLNEKMKNYYLANLDNPNLRKNPYKYTKLMCANCDSGVKREMQSCIGDTNEREDSQVPASTSRQICTNAEEMDQIGHLAKDTINDTSDVTTDEVDEADEAADVMTYPQNQRDIRKMNNFLLEINKIYLGRQAEFWELHDTDSVTDLKKKNNEEKILMEKLIDKLEDYKQKMQIDNDPVNEIEESEKSKNDPVFKFRLAKLFIVKYIDLYTIVKDKEFSTDCDFLYNLMVHMDKNLAKKKILLSAQEGEGGDVNEEADGQEKEEGEEATAEAESEPKE